MQRFLLGSDPELFLTNAGGKFISSIGLFGGTKDNPRPMQGLPKGFFVQEDNVAVEFNIPPAPNFARFSKSIQSALSWIGEKAAANGLTLSMVPSATFDDDQLEDPRARVFGCDPDYNAWTLEPNPRPQSEFPNLRSCGGHLHVGIALPDVKKIALIRWMDIFVGLWSLQKDPDNRRRELYGKAGAMRFKPYGVEYRTVSNFWLNSPEFMEGVYDGVDAAVGAIDVELPETYGNAAVFAINTGNKAVAEEVYKDCLNLVYKTKRQRIMNEEQPRRILPRDAGRVDLAEQARQIAARDRDLRARLRDAAGRANDGAGIQAAQQVAPRLVAAVDEAAGVNAAWIEAREFLANQPVGNAVQARRDLNEEFLEELNEMPRRAPRQP